MNLKRTLPFLIPLLLCLAPELYARAGGGGGGGGGGRGNILLLPVIVIYLAVLHYKLHKKNREAEALIAAASALDSGWRIDSLRQRISDCYFKVQEAWMQRNQELARTYMSRRLYASHKEQTDAMLRKGETNILQNIQLLEARIVEAIDYQDNSKDSFWVYIKGAMKDFTLKDGTNELLKGDPDKTEKFTELWKFIREDGRWVLDAIDSEVEMKDLDSFHSQSA